MADPKSHRDACASMLAALELPPPQWPRGLLDKAIGVARSTYPSEEREALRRRVQALLPKPRPDLSKVKGALVSKWVAQYGEAMRGVPAGGIAAPPPKPPPGET